MTPTDPAPAFGTVVDWLEGRLDADESATIERLVRAEVPDVMADVVWWRRFRAAALLPTEPVPNELAARLRALEPRSSAAAVSHDPTWLDRLVGAVRATLSFDSLNNPGLAMARSSSDATRQLVFSGPGLDVAIDLSEPRGDELTATAQLLPLDDGVDAADVLVETWTRSGRIGETRSDALGRVELGVLPADVVVMEVDSRASWPAVHTEMDLRRPG